jgi:hypothetical protein
MEGLGFLGKIAEGKIQEAIDEGKFDDLPGEGKPIIFDDDPMTPPHLRMVNRILKNANALPEWIQVQKDIEADQARVTAMRSRLIKDNERWRKRLSLPSARTGADAQYGEWHAKSRAAYHKLMKSVNSAILKYTLIAPPSARPIPSYKLQPEMELFDAEVPCATISSVPGP